MKAHQLFQHMPAALSNEIADWLRQDEKAVFKAAITSLAQQRNLRPVFVQKKSREQQAAWMLESLKLRPSEAIGENLLQVWLMKSKPTMLASFLDEIAVPHDGKGGVESELPKTLDAAKVKAGIDKLLGSFPHAQVAVYLHLFQLQQPGGWPEISAALTNDSRLKVGPAA